MIMDRNMMDSKLYKYMDWLSTIVLANSLFLLFLLPLILLVINQPISLTRILLYCVALIPTSLGLQGLLTTMIIFQRDLSVSVFSEFMKGVKRNFKQSLLLGCVSFPILTILLVDILQALNKQSWLLFALYVVLFILVAAYAYCLAVLLAKYEMPTKELFRLGVYSLAFHFAPVIKMLSYFAYVVITLKYFPALGILFIFGLLAYFTIKSGQPIFEKLEKELMKQDETNE